MKVGVLASGDIAVRAAHSLSAQQEISEVVVVGRARSQSFPVEPDAKGCELLVGSGPAAPGLARKFGVALVWDGDAPEDGVAVWGASPVGLALSLAAREHEPRLVAMAHPLGREGQEGMVRFPEPVGRLQAADHTPPGAGPVALAKSQNQYAAVLVESPERHVTVVDEGRFMSGVCLAAGIAALDDHPVPVWERSLGYLEMATGMGLVMAES